MNFITSALIDVPHGFSTRDGGISTGPFASLNLGLMTGDDRANVQENLRRVADAARAATLATVSQVHGTAIARARPDELQVPAPIAEADAVWTNEPGVAVGVKTADCVPILLLDRRTGAVAAIHAGWKGTLAEIAARTIETLKGQGSDPVDLVAAIGPCIRVCCYEVAPELAAQFTDRFGSQAANGRMLDLVTCVAQTLEQAGVPKPQIDRGGACTSCEPDRFYSHRRDRGITGRHLSFITCG